MKISAVEGNRQKLDGGAMFGNAPRAVWQQWLAPDAQNRIDLACRCLLLEFDKYKVLCETGIGAFFEPKLAERYGIQTPSEHRLLRSLQNLQVAEEDITHVILSHLHFDHAGGLLPPFAELAAGHERLLFPKAQYLVGKEAFQRASKPHPRDRASFIPGLTSKLQASQRLVLISGEEAPAELRPFIRFLYSHGHTPGHMHSLIQGEKGQVLFCGDLIPGLAWLHTPITMGYDRYAELVIDEKTQIYEQAIHDHWLLFFTHDPELSMVSCQRDQHGKVIASSTHRDCVRYPL